MSNFISKFGVYAQKVGMSRIYLEKKAIAITLLKVPTSHVLSKQEKDDHVVVKLGVDEYKTKIKQPQQKEFEKNGQPACGLVKEFKITKEEAAKLGEKIAAEWMNLGCLVDVQSKSMGKGFAGAMKKWGFAGQGASHGATKSHRKIGSTGTRDKIFKNRKMPGRMGHDVITVQNQKVIYKDEQLCLIGIAGCVPGKAGTWVRVTKAIKGSGVGYES